MPERGMPIVVPHVDIREVWEKFLDYLWVGAIKYCEVQWRFAVAIHLIYDGSGRHQCLNDLWRDSIKYGSFPIVASLMYISAMCN